MKYKDFDMENLQKLAPEAQEIFQQMDMEKAYPIINKKNKYDFRIMMVIWGILSLGLTYFAVEDIGFNLSTIFTGIASLVFNFFVLLGVEYFISKVSFLPFILVPGYWGLRHKYIKYLSQWVGVLGNRKKQYVLLDFFGEIVALYKKEKRISQSIYDNKLEKLKKIFMKPELNRAELAIYLEELYGLYREMAYEIDFKTYKDSVPSLDPVEIEKENGKTFNF